MGATEEDPLEVGHQAVDVHRQEVQEVAVDVHQLEAQAVHVLQQAAQEVGLEMVLEVRVE